MDSNEEGPSPHTSQTIYFYNINANKVSAKENHVELLFEQQ